MRSRRVWILDLEPVPRLRESLPPHSRSESLLNTVRRIQSCCFVRRRRGRFQLVLGSQHRRYVPPLPPPNAPSPSSKAIAGGVVAGLFIIPLLAFLILRSRRQRALAAQSDTFSMYSGREKSVVGGPGIPRPGTPSQSYYGGGAQEYGERFHSPTVDGQGGMEMGRYPAPSGTLPEPVRSLPTHVSTEKYG
jgi:hypothetical protein